MVEEVAHYLFDNNGVKYLDCTFGAGGHTAHLLEKASRPIEVFGIDLDIDAVASGKERFKGFKNVQIEHGDYGCLVKYAKQYGLHDLDGILADFGQSSDQLASKTVGMSYSSDSNLDMRYNRTSGITAEEFLNNINYDDLKRLLKDVGQESNAARLSKAIIQAKPLKTTSDLERAVRSVTFSHQQNKVLSKVFMVVRVAVNDELGAIDRFLLQAPALLKSGGRILCISFDSNQDRRVKNSFRSLENPCICPPHLPVCVCNRIPTMKVLTSHALKPTDSEIELNKRCRSAKLRIAEKI